MIMHKMFIDVCKKLKIMKGVDAIGLGKFHKRQEEQSYEFGYV